jgi:hypothetical protein
MILRYPWRRGPVAPNGRVVISATRFTYKRFRDLLPVSAHATRLWRGWPERSGAIGLFAGGQPWRRVTYSVSVWESEEDLRGFLRAPDHVPLMREYRPRLERSISTTWEADGVDPGEVWREAMRRLEAAA